MTPGSEQEVKDEILVDSSPLPVPLDFPPEPVLAKEASVLIDCFKRATVITGQIVNYSAMLKQQRIPDTMASLPQNLVSQLGAELDRYDQTCDVMQDRLLESMAVLRRDIERQKAKVTAEQKSKAPPKEIETIVLSSDDEEDEVSKPNRKPKVDSDGVIHLDSDSDTEAPAGGSSRPVPPLPQRNSAPHGISLSSLQSSPPGGGIIDLTSIADSVLSSPSIHPSTVVDANSAFSPKRRPSVSLRLDLSSDALRGVSFMSMDPTASALAAASGVGPPSPVTLAPRTARPLSAHPSGMVHDPFFAGGDGGLMPPLPIGLGSSSVDPNEALLMGAAGGSGGDIMGLVGPSLNMDGTHSHGSGAGGTGHEMDVDLFGGMVSSPSDVSAAAPPGDTTIQAIGGDAGNEQQLQIQQLLAQHASALGMGPEDGSTLSVSMGGAELSQNPSMASTAMVDSMSLDAASQPQQEQGGQESQESQGTSTETNASTASLPDPAQVQSQVPPPDSTTLEASMSLDSLPPPSDPAATSAPGEAGTGAEAANLDFQTFDMSTLDGLQMPMNMNMSLDDMSLDFLNAAGTGSGVGGGDALDLSSFDAMGMNVDGLDMSGMDFSAMLSGFDPTGNGSGAAGETAGEGDGRAGGS